MIPYATMIDLDQPFRPAAGTADLDAVVAAILADAASTDFCNSYAVPRAAAEKRRWVRAALTVRMPGNLPDAVVEGMDRVLQAELATKTLTDAADLPRLQSDFPIADKVSIWNGDISTLKIGAITNAANAQMLGCFQPFHACIDNVIQCAAGPQLREDSHKIMSFQGHDEETGSAKITRAYNLPSKYVLHTVGPIVPTHSPTQEQADQLANCYKSCLTLAAQAGVRSIAFCGISTGVFGYPADQAAKVALRAVADWVQACPDTMDHVVFNTFGEAATAIYHQEIDQWT
jgi:O-acetyl-ADP-ribose deacetylase (regulator of RNase III)